MSASSPALAQNGPQQVVVFDGSLDAVERRGHCCFGMAYMYLCSHDEYAEVILVIAGALRHESCFIANGGKFVEGR